MNNFHFGCVSNNVWAIISQDEMSMNDVQRRMPNASPIF